MTAFNSRDGGFFLTTVGRVQTPTLSIVVEREEKIRKHVARDYWEIQRDLRGRRPASTTASGSTRSGRRTRTTPERARRPRSGTSATRRPSPTRCAASRPRSPRKPSRARRRARLLYDLTTLQREANSRFGFSAKTTLSLAQALYEKHKVLTYPRTDSQRAARGLRRRRQAHDEDDLDRGPARPAARARRAREDGAEGGLRQAEQAHLRQRQGLGPLRHHPDAAGAAQPVRDRGQAVRHGRQALPGGVLPVGRVHGHDAHLDGQGGRQRAHVPDQRQGDGQAGLARRLRPRGAGGRRQPGGGRSRASWCAPRASTSTR